MDKLQKIHHLLDRAAFGPSFNELPSYGDYSLQKLTNGIFTSSRDFTELDVVDRESAFIRNPSSLTPEEKRAFRKKQRALMLDLNVAWISKMSTTGAVLREKMTLFWHDHFACNVKNPYFAQELNNSLRRNALGSFGKMLFEVSKSPAMLQFLNNQQNRAKSPNENFAREVMELFTLGRDHYTEDDIKNAARAFTGWGFNRDGEFVFRSKQHDYGRKTFMGKRGNFGGEDILKMLLENRQTSRYLTEKIYRYFINEEVDEDFLNSLSGGFYNSGYNIARLMYDIFTSDRFYDDANLNSLVKSPSELIVGYGRLLPVTSFDKKSIIRMQRALDQVLFMPPNVGGWPYGKEWINSTSVVYRMQLPYTFLPSGKGKHKKWMTMDVDWQQFRQKTQGMSQEELTTLIIGRAPTAEETALIEESTSRFRYAPVKKTVETILWLCLPEYQLG